MLGEYRNAAYEQYKSNKAKAHVQKESLCGAALATGLASESRDVCGAATGNSDSPLRKEAQQRAEYHRTEADRADRAVAFFRENPAFDEFIRLIREGVVQI